MKVGDRVRFSHPLPDGGSLTFSARVVRLNGDGSATVRIPDRVRGIPFPPAGGAMFARYRAAETRNEAGNYRGSGWTKPTTDRLVEGEAGS